ncbi:VWD domain-containing protein [filamentous cyanobacterium LEGE 11480]|uniref:VWD domain-containing protein n=1 Tax=Romeriopsis navalis LEGE 11480 TaxID=2777977 RepID=A0A928VQ22_9CYAN|nr:VWD domain-containing protein [Romeriopsis navalis]MBE9031662.1 VWD domain-containing protein [Romeriopsis navalis LEGE 11480]
MQKFRQFRRYILVLVGVALAIGIEGLLRRGIAVMLSGLMLGTPSIGGELLAQAQIPSGLDVEQIFEASPTETTDTDTVTPTTRPSDPVVKPPTSCQLTASGDLVQGRSYGDPHFKTLDGKRYSFQAVGEFGLIDSQNNSFKVQARHAAVRESLSLNSAVAMQICGDRVGLYAQDFPDGDRNHVVWVNGKPLEVGSTPVKLPTGGAIALKGNVYVINSPTGEKVTAAKSTVSQQSFFNIAVFVPSSQRNQVQGLLGNFNGDPKDDLQIRGKGVLPERSSYGDVRKALSFAGLNSGPVSLSGAERLYFKQMYKEFGNSWRVSAAESLFDYPAGRTTASFVNMAFPKDYLTLNMLGRQRINAARKTCQQARVPADTLEGCIFDVGFSGMSGFARTTAQVNSYLRTAQELFPGLGIPTVDQAVDRVIDQVRPKVCLPFIGCR